MRSKSSPKRQKREKWREKGRESREESDFGGKSRRSSKLSAFQGGPRAESIHQSGGTEGGFGGPQGYKNPGYKDFRYSGYKDLSI